MQPYWNLNIFGALVTDIHYNTQRPFAPGTPFFLLPEFGLDTQTFDMHARQSQFGVVLTGPEICGCQSGGVALAAFYNDAVTVDRYGFLPLLAYGELKNENMRFSAGLQFDVFCPNAPNMLVFSILGASETLATASAVKPGWNDISVRPIARNGPFCSPLANRSPQESREETHFSKTMDGPTLKGVSCMEKAHQNKSAWMSAAPLKSGCQASWVRFAASTPFSDGL